MPIKTLTFSGTSADETYPLNYNIPSGSTIILTTARLDLDFTGLSVAGGNFFRHVNLEIGNTINSANVIDNVDKTNYLQFHLSNDIQTVGGEPNICVSDYEPNVSYTIGADMPNQARIVIRNPLSSQPVSNLKYFFFQFNVIPN